MPTSAGTSSPFNRVSVLVRAQSLLLLSAAAFSTAGFFTRVAPVDLWAMVFWRNAFGIVALIIVALSTSSTFGSLWRSLGLRECVVIASASLGTICYLAAFAHTSVADISIIYATAPLITAALAWLWLREAMSRRTLAASCAALIGVGVTFVGSWRVGSATGDGLALMMTVSLSIMTVAARGTKLAAVPTALVASAVAAAAVLPLGLASNATFAIEWREAAWLAGFGVVTMAVALPCYLIGAADVPAGRAMLISAIELPLAPLWVWLAFGEVPAAASAIGGSIVTAAILSDLIGKQVRV